MITQEKLKGLKELFEVAKLGDKALKLSARRMIKKRIKKYYKSDYYNNFK